MLEKYLDSLIFVAFLLLNIAVGWRRYRSKKQTFKEYAIGDKTFSTATLTATIVATWMSGNLFFTALEDIHGQGLYYVIGVILGGITGLLIVARVIGPHMGKFLDHVSMPEALGKFYGKTVQFIAGISCVLGSVGYTAVQFQVMAKILTIVFGYESSAFVFLAATIVTLYSLSGGVKAVTFTDVLQFFTFGTVLPMLALAVWNNLDDHSQVGDMLTSNPHFSLTAIFQWSPEFVSMLGFLAYCILPTLEPELFQRLVMAKNTTQVKHSVTWAAFICLGLKLCLAWIAILVLTDCSGISGDAIVPYLVNTHVPFVLKGFLGVGVLAMAMSTADSTINSTAVIISNDILAPLYSQETGSLRTARRATLFLGVFSMCLAFYIKDMLDILLLSACFYAPVVLVPMLLAIFGFQTSRRVVLMAMGMGAVTVAVFLIRFQRVDSFFPGMLVNLGVMLGAHYLLREEGGWGYNPLRDKEKERHLRILQPLWKRQLTGQKERKSKLHVYLERSLPTEEYFYSLFGFYVFTSTYASLYLLPPEIPKQFPNLYGFIQYSVLLLFTTFLAFPIWPSALKNKRLLTWLWPLCAFYTLFGMGVVLVVLSDFAIQQVLILMFNFVMGVLLLHWSVAVAMVAFGIMLLVLFSDFYCPDTIVLSNLDVLRFTVPYGLLLLSSFLIALFKHKETYDLLTKRNKERSSERKITQQELVTVLGSEKRFFSEPTEASTHALEAVNKQVDDFIQQAQVLSDMHRSTSIHHALEDVRRVFKVTMMYLTNVVYRIQGCSQLKVSYASVDELFNKAMLVFQAQHVHTSSRIHIKDTTKKVLVLECDTKKVQQLLVNAWLYMEKNNNLKQPVYSSVQRTTLGYPIPSVKDSIKEVPALCITISNQQVLPKPKKLYMGVMGNTTYQVPQSMRDMPLLDNQRIIDAHYGAVQLINTSGNVTSQVYVFPIHLREVRPSMVDLPKMDVRSTHEIKDLALSEETTLLKKLHKDTVVSVELAEKAIQYIKKYYSYTCPKTGKPFYLHSIAVTEIVLRYTEDQATVFAALLYDSVENTPLTLSEIGVVFGASTAEIVNKTIHLGDQFRRIKADIVENVRQLLEETDIRVLHVKLADLLQNVRAIERYTSITKQKKMVQETLQFSIPIAKKLGLKQLEEELQECIEKVIKKK